MDQCLEYMQRLNAALGDPSQDLTQAIENLRTECLGTNEADDRNIPATILDALERACRETPPSTCDELTGLVAEYQTIRHPSHFQPRLLPEDKALLRVVPKAIFLDHHLLSASGPGSADAAGNRRKIRRWLCKKQSDLIELDQMNGHTGRPDAPSWWTFEEDDHPLPDDPRRYCQELALTSIDAVDVYIEQGIVEVVVPGQHLPAQVYKPCSLDAFHPCTRFRPDSDARPYGYTCPQDTKLHGRPELITLRIAYRDLKDLRPDDTLEIRCLQPPTGASTNASNRAENGS